MTSSVKTWFWKSRGNVQGSMFHFKGWGPWRVTSSFLVSKGTRCLGILRTSILMPCYLDALLSTFWLPIFIVFYLMQNFISIELCCSEDPPLGEMWYTTVCLGHPALQFALEWLWVSPAAWCHCRSECSYFQNVPDWTILWMVLYAIPLPEHSAIYKLISTIIFLY